MNNLMCYKYDKTRKFTSKTLLGTTCFSQLACIRGIVLLEFGSFLGIQKPAVCSLVIFFVAAFCILYRFSGQEIVLCLLLWLDCSPHSSPVSDGTHVLQNLFGCFGCRSSFISIKSKAVCFVLLNYMLELPPPGNNDRV